MYEKGINENISSIIPSLLNTIAVLILNTIYETYVVLPLTELENHRTVTEMENSLISKLFIFSFINFSNS